MDIAPVVKKEYKVSTSGGFCLVQPWIEGAKLSSKEFF